MEYNKTPTMGMPEYLRNCNCEGGQDKPLHKKTDYDIDGRPIAMTYVPMQRWEELYDPPKALKRGTIFPSLDLPFKGGGVR